MTELVIRQIEFAPGDVPRELRLAGYRGAIDIEGMADAFDIERCSGGRQILFGNSKRYHLTTARLI